MSLNDEPRETCGEDIPDEIKMIVEDMPEHYGADEMDPD